MKAIAVKGISNTGGIAIYEIHDGYEAYVKWRLEYGQKEPGKMRKSKIYYTVSSGRAFFKVNGSRQYLDEFMRL